MMQLIKESLDAVGVKYKDGRTAEDERGEILRLRIGGHDKRRITFKGWVELENFRYAETDGSFCLMTRDVVGLFPLSTPGSELTQPQGNPISWRQLWKTLVLSPAVDPHVLRR
jgi:serine/threonine-protein kinase Chk1